MDSSGSPSRHPARRYGMTGSTIWNDWLAIIIDRQSVPWPPGVLEVDREPARGAGRARSAHRARFQHRIARCGGARHRRGAGRLAQQIGDGVGDDAFHGRTSYRAGRSGFGPKQNDNLEGVLGRVNQETELTVAWLALETTAL